MAHIYGLDAVTSKLAADAAAIATNILAPHAADVDSKARFPKEALTALREKSFLGMCVAIPVGGGGHGPRAFAAVVEELAMGCASTAAVYVMHVAAHQAIAASTLLIKRHEILAGIASGRHLATLAFSEKGSRSHFWAPVSRMEEKNGAYVTSAEKSWVTAAHHADLYVSSAQRPGAKSSFESTVYLLHRDFRGIHIQGSFQGMGLRGNDSVPVTLENVTINRSDLISAPGEGAKTMLQIVLPWFCIGFAALANGLCRAAVEATTKHLTQTRLEHTKQHLCDLPTLRARLAQMNVRTEQARALLGHTLSLMEQPTDATPLMVLQTRLASLEAAVDVTDLAMKTCGGAAFSGHLSIDRIFRDARAGWVMTPTVDHLMDFVGRSLTGLPPF